MAKVRDRKSASGFVEPTARREIRSARGRIRRGESQKSEIAAHQSSVYRSPVAEIALLTGGDDKPYVLGLVEALTSKGVSVDVIGSDDLAVPELVWNPRVNFLNLRGDQAPQTMLRRKIIRILAYYCRLLRYAIVAKPTIFHILWNNKFELFDLYAPHDLLQARWKEICVDCT